MQQFPAYIVAARRTSLGRVGGLHRSRRIDALAAPVVQAVLADAKIASDDVDEIVIGNATEGGNPARLIALAAGLPDRVAAATIDRQCGSGLDAILTAIRSVGLGEADVIVAGGADSVSTAPWRVARPMSPYQTPHFLRLEPAMESADDMPAPFEASEALARRFGITRERQDQWALDSFDRATAARTDRRFVGEIVPLRANAEEARDQSSIEPDADEFANETPFVPGDGTLTPANTSTMHDGAAMVVVVSERMWTAMGRPPALRLVQSSVRGVSPAAEAAAPIEAMQTLYSRLNGFNTKDIGVFEMSEASAAQAVAFIDVLGLDPAIVNPAGGAIARGHPFGAAGAVLVVRLFTTLVRDAARDGTSNRHGVAALGTIGGIGLAALFERV
ncbi:MAG: thiolase family protein [Hyphomicrobiaceae bacterium]|nr:thiolase family protein [Hyphomicrobiaceae bacterium]